MHTFAYMHAYVCMHACIRIYQMNFVRYITYKMGLQDTAGPSIHVLIKMLATITLVMAPLFLDSQVPVTTPIRPSATSLSGLQLLVYQALSY